MNGFISEIEHRTESNTDFRHVLYTGPNLQLVLMSLEPGEEIGDEVHAHTDQFFRVESGKGVVVMHGRETPIEDDMAIIVPAGTRHNIRNTGHKTMKLYTLYAPPEHAPFAVHHTKADADRAEIYAGR